MPSPQRPPRGSPARRAALHERSDSHTNERASPTLRMVGDPQAPIYGSSPFPTKPSQILSPKGYNNVQGSTGAEFGVSHGQDPPGETTRLIEDSSNVATFQSRKRSDDNEENHDVPSTQRSPTTASFYTPPALSPMQTNTSFPLLDQPAEDTGRVSDDIVQLPNVPPKPAAAEPYPTSNPHATPGRQPVISKESDSSLSSLDSTGTVIVRKNRNGGKCASYSAFPSIRPSSSRSNLSLSTPQRSANKDPAGEQSPVSPVSPLTPVSSSFTTMSDRRTSSVPLYGNLQAASQSSLNLQYPVICPPAASASWAESPTSQTQRSQRTLERAQDRWNPHLSTVQSVRSEGTGSQSDERTSQTMWLPDSFRVSKSSSMAMNARGSSDLPPVPSPPIIRRSSDLSPLPSPPPVQQRDITGSSTIRVVNEQDDELRNLPPLIPGSRGSEYLGVPPGHNRGGVVTRRASRASFFRDSIPAWAKAYYARPTSSASLPKSRRDSRPSTSTGEVSLNVFRPKTRAGETNGQGPGSTLGGPSRPRELNLAEVRDLARPTTSSNWSPHLLYDRRSLGRRRTIFQPPSLDEQAEGKALSKRNAQILLFAVGFIFPPGKLLLGVLSTIVEDANNFTSLVHRIISPTASETCDSQRQRQRSPDPDCRGY